jgi:3D (Asp-Asp-Asp) domain-containing protein
MKKMLMTIVTATFLVFGFSEVSLAASNATTYSVKKGDSLWKIANIHKISVNQLKGWNNLKSDLIKPNQVLKVQNTTSTVKQASTPKTASSKTITVKATAFTANCKGCSGITATGINLKKNPSAKVIAVDPKVIPLGTKVHVEGYGEAIAGDKGGAIKGNKIDVFISSKQKAINWGVKTVKVQVYK